MLKILNTYKENGWLVSQTHPTLPLTIWNYSRKTQYEGYWDEITIQCRGLVTDDETGEIVARPFKKFWNIEEAKHTPTKDFYVLEKLDGSLGIAFNYKDEWIFASKGSFISDQALKGIEFMDDKIMELSAYPLNDEYTYMFEILYQENLIVVRYDFEGLVLLGMLHTKTGEELSYKKMETLNGGIFRVVKRLDTNLDFNSLKKLNTPNEEGFVVIFSNGDKIKIKFEEYFRLHKIMTEVSTTAIWDMLRTGSPMDELLTNVPDEFYDKIKKEIERQKYSFVTTFEYFGKLFDSYLENRNQELPERAEYSEWVNTFSKREHPIFWRLYDNRGYSDIIWRLNKPKFLKL